MCAKENILSMLIDPNCDLIDGLQRKGPKQGGYINWRVNSLEEGRYVFAHIPPLYQTTVHSLVYSMTPRRRGTYNLVRLPINQYTNGKANNGTERFEFLIFQASI